MPASRPLRVITVAAAASLLFLTSCGGDSQEYPAKVAEDFLHALADQDAEAACDLMVIENVPATQNDTSLNECLSGVNSFFTSEDFAEEIAGYENAKVESVEVDGNEADMPSEAATGVLDPSISLDLQFLAEKWYVADISS